MFSFYGHRSGGPAPALCMLLLFAVGCSSDTNQIASAPEAEPEEPDPVTVTVFTDKVELFMEYPRMVPGLEARFLAHVTVLATGEPVRSGQLRLELSPIDGAPKAFFAPAPARDGLFIPVGVLSSPGEYKASIVIESDQVEETIALEPIVVYADKASAFAAAEAESGAEPKNAVPFLLEQQWPIGLLMEQAERRSMIQRLQVPGEIEVPQGSMAVVGAPLAGRLTPPESGVLPRLGDRVKKGQVLGFLEPPLSTSDAAQVAGNEAQAAANKLSLDTLEMGLLIREFDVRARSVEIEQALRQANARLDFAQQALARIEGLREKDLGTAADLAAARRDVELATRARDGSESLKASLAESMDRLAALRLNRASTRESDATMISLRIPLISPIDGEIVEADHVAGEHIESQGAVFRVIEPSRVWIAAHISEFDFAGLGDEPGALLKFAAYPDRTFDVLGAMEGRVAHVGRVVHPETRTIALRYEAANPDGLLRAGMFADVFLETQRTLNAITVPEEAIVMHDGRPVAFVLLDGETFQKRDLELGIRDGRFVEVLSGIDEGDRVATKGAYLVKLASASPASFGEGHAH